MFSRDFKRKMLAWFVKHIGTHILSLWFSTCRVQIKGRDAHERFIKAGEKAVGGTWHRGAIFLVWYYRRIKPMILFSRSRDGELIAGYAEKLGTIPTRGSTSRGGREAMREMMKFMEQSGPRQAATVLDGPKGPRFLAKKGMLFLAKHAGVPLLPIMISAHPAITFKKTWDRSILPLPFSRVIVSYGNSIQIPGDVNSAGLESLRQEVQNTLNDMMVEADTETGYKAANPDVYEDYFPTECNYCDPA